MTAIKKVLTICVSIVLWAVILLAALFAFTSLATRDDSHVANLLGYTPMTVQTDSMSPTFNAGDLIIIHTCEPENLQVGDIITFHTIIMNEYALNTHRIASIDTNGGVRSYTTKGDNNMIEDSHVIAGGDIVGKYVTRLPGVGRVMDFLSSTVGFLVVIVLPMLAFFIYQIYHLVMVSVSLKKAMAVEAAVEAEQAVQQSRAASSEADDEAKRLKEEAEAALAEAKRIKEEAEAALAKAKADAANVADAAEEATVPEQDNTEEGNNP